MLSIHGPAGGRGPGILPDMTSTSSAIGANRALWDEWAAIHAEGSWYDLDAVRRGADKLRDYEVDEIGDVSGMSMLHLQCQIGTDSIAWARRGATVTGVDFSPVAVEKATSLASDIGVEASFVCSDVMELDKTLEGEFDIVYASRGILGWIPDFAEWSRIVAHFLKPGGFLYLTDIHPVAKVLDDASNEVRIARPYWPRPEPIRYDVRGTYADPSAKVESSSKYLWTHSTGEVITSVAQAGMCVEFFHEFPWLDRPWPCLSQETDRTFTLPDGVELPMFFSLKARKLSS